MDYKVFIVEDEKGIADGIVKALSEWGISAKAADDFKNIVDSFKEYAPHLVLMDISLPFMDGYHWCREIRNISSVPIIFLSSMADNMNIVMAMNMGADDFIAKPFDKSVLIAKIQAVLRRSYALTSKAPTLDYKGISLNTDDCSIYCNGEKTDLSKNEYRILLTLIQNKGKVVSREKLMEVLWQTDDFVDENTLSVNVGRVRKKLEAIGLKDCITTKFGVGYILEDN